MLFKFKLKEDIQRIPLTKNNKLNKDEIINTINRVRLINLAIIKPKPITPTILRKLSKRIPLLSDKVKVIVDKIKKIMDMIQRITRIQTNKNFNQINRTFKEV